MSKRPAGIFRTKLIFLVETVSASNSEEDDDDDDPKVLIPHETKFTKAVKGHYLKSNFWFFVGIICAMLAGSKDYCLSLIYVVLGIKLVQLVAFGCGYLWLCFLCDLGDAAVNYVNIFAAINFFNSQSYYKNIVFLN